MKTMLFNPYSGKPRDPRDIASDPAGILMLDPDEPVRAALASTPAVPDSAVTSSRMRTGAEINRVMTHAQAIDEILRLDAVIASYRAGAPRDLVISKLPPLCAGAPPAPPAAFPCCCANPDAVGVTHRQDGTCHWTDEPVAQPARASVSAKDAAKPLSQEDSDLLQTTIEQLEDHGETDTPYEKLMDWAARGYFECQHFEIRIEAHKAIEASRSLTPAASKSGTI